jgi:DNA-binding beta-propeller fold protein YncE
MAVHPAGKAVLVAVENTDLISLIDNDPSSKTYRKVVGNFDVRTPEMKDRKLWGAGPNHLTFSPDGKRLFATVGLLNAVAVVRLTGDTAGSMKVELEGYLPTLWYPHTTEISQDGQTLFLTSEGKEPAEQAQSAFPSRPASRVYGPILLKGFPILCR